MVYIKKDWIHAEIIDESELEHMEDGIESAHITVDTHITDAPEIHLTVTERAAIAAATSPTGGNPFATIADVDASGDMYVSIYDTGSDNITNVVDSADKLLHLGVLHSYGDIIGDLNTKVPITTKGDILSHNGSGSVRIGAGTHGQVLITNPDVTNGIEWATNYDSTGCTTQPSITDNENGTFDIPSKDVVMHSTTDFTGPRATYTIPAIDDLVVADNTTTFIVADYNGGSPIWNTTIDAFAINNSNIIDYGGVYRSGNNIQFVDYGSVANGLSNKLLLRLLFTDQFARETGVLLGEDTDREVTITDGVVWNGVDAVALAEFASKVDTLTKWYHSASVWTSTEVDAYENDEYDNGTNLVAATADYYIVNWVYRTNSSTEEESHIVVGGQYPNLDAAEIEPIPSDIPEGIRWFGILVGRIIVKTNDAVASSISSAFSIDFTAAGIEMHNSLANLQGGATDDYWHLTSAERTTLLNHETNTSNPHNVTKTQVGLGNVTDDAQLKRAGSDINTFPEKTTIVADDVFLIEDSVNSYAKKRAKLSSLSGYYLPLSGGTMTGTIITRGSGAAGIQIGDDGLLIDIDQVDMIGVWGNQTNANGGFVFGNAEDTNLYRLSANILKTDDEFRCADLISSGIIKVTNTVEIEYNATTQTLDFNFT